MSKQKKQTSRSLVTQRLENVSKQVFKQYFNLITELIGSSPGIYALYDDNELYYVGKSIDLRKRVKQHLRDKHLASWTHFSLYLVRTEDHIHEIESLLIRISNPKGNSIKPKGKASSAMLKKLKEMVKAKQKEELDKMFGTKKAGKKVKKESASANRDLKGLVTNRTLLFKVYKGKEYKAMLNPGGTINLGKRKFTSPTAAAKTIVDRKSVNGWKFWFIKDDNGDWVKLADYK